MVCAGRVPASRYSAMVPYEVSTPVFEGPFDLLLHLIARQQVDIYEVSLSAIVDAYVAHLEHLRLLDLEVATEFLLIAAVLLELKARRLLPDEEDADAEEELALWEERDLLLARLFECRTFKDAAAALDRIMATASRSHPRRAGLEEPFVDPRPRPDGGDHARGDPSGRRLCPGAEAGKPRPPRPRGPHPGLGRRRRRGAASTSCPGRHRPPSGASPRGSPIAWRSSCGSSPSSSSTSRA